MTDEKFCKLRDLATLQRFQMCDAKSVEYTRGNLDDRLCNFKRIAVMLDLPTEKVWAVYFLKHVDAIVEYVKTGKQGTEGIAGRIDDAQNYLDLLRGLTEENECLTRDLARATAHARVITGAGA